MNDHILEFIKKQHTANLCCVSKEGIPHCFSCFFAVNGDKALLYFKTSPDTKHGTIMKVNGVVAGTILPDKFNMMAIQGIQFTGFLIPGDDKLAKNASVHYYKKFPYAMAMSGEIWTIQVTSVKMTDNRKGFGKKLNWELKEK